LPARYFSYHLVNKYSVISTDYSLKKPFYWPELDVFRAFAILLVIVSHWFPGLHSPIDLGSVGVTAFFVLSGFLITTILRRAAPEFTGRSKLSLVYSFFARRILRLLPAYYCALLIAWGLRLTYMAQAWQWFVLHGANIFLFRQQHWGEGMGHFWSLAVEEQFYLFWPAVILVMSHYRIRIIISVLVVGGPLLRWWLMQRTGTPFSLILTPACLDLFAIGAGLSLVLDNLHLRARFWFCTALVSGCTYCLLEVSGYSICFLSVGPSFLALAAAASIAFALTTDFAPAQWLLRQPALVTVGRLSYGLYLYHLFMPIMLHRLLHHLGRFIMQGRYYQRFIDWETTVWAGAFMGITLCIVASVSWRFIEQPFLRLQRFFPYSKVH
jgi:peptidoglycan/LPS O-acetylase OafA/YrhL